MHETRNFIMVLLVIGSFLWGFVAWFVLDVESAPVLWFQRVTSLLLFVSMAVTRTGWRRGRGPSGSSGWCRGRRRARRVP